MNTDDAFKHCERIARAQARNFAYGIRLLPLPKRQALSAVYALARRIDDVGDGSLPARARLDELERIRAQVRTLSVPTGGAPSPDPVLHALRAVAARYPLPLGAFDELIDGCELDCTRTTIQTYDELVQYCRLVAGSIGRLSVSILGVRDMAVAAPLADALGIALQMTNILRDIVEDREQLGRVYIPRQEIVGFGCRDDLTGDRDTLALLVSYEARRARSWYEQGLTLLPLLDYRSRACVATMAGIYRRLLGRIEAEPELPLLGRVSLPAWEKAWLASRALAGLPA
jgi:phytoene synthase